MDIDLDWCLTCERRNDGPSPYCYQCINRAGPSCYKQPSEGSFHEEDEVIFHPIDDTEHLPHASRWTGNDFEGISAWASQIPIGAVVDEEIIPSSQETSSFRLRPSPVHRKPPPNLLKPNRRPAPPTLSTTTPPMVLPPPSTPIITPKRQPSFGSVARIGNASTGQTSMQSAATESSLIATPPPPSKPVPISVSRKPSMFEDVYSHVLTWASPSPALIPSKQIPPAPISRVDQHKFALPTHTTTPAVIKVVSSLQSSPVVSEQSAGYWMAGPALMERPSTKKLNLYEPSRGRELVCYHDEHPSFRTRGRKASRAAA